MSKPRPDLRLAVDIGNTNTVIGLFDGSEIKHRWRLATRKDTTVDEIAISLHGLMRHMLRHGQTCVSWTPSPSPPGIWWT